MKEDYYIFKRQFYYRAHEQSVFSVEIYPGIVADFGESKSKLYSKKFKLTQVKFSKSEYSNEVITDFLRRFHIMYIEKWHNGKKLPPIYKVIGNPSKPIKDGFIVVCENSSGTRETYSRQNSYDFWFNEFYKKSKFCRDSKTVNTAIPLLINRIQYNEDLLSQIPFSNSRILEELVAEIFKEFGYVVELTKKTRDGGRDIIALKKTDGNDEKILIECKHWSDKIRVSTIRELIGVAASEDELPTGIILATTSRFTCDAEKIKINDTIKIDLARKDFDDIINWVDDYDAIQFSRTGINAYFDSLKLEK